MAGVGSFGFGTGPQLDIPFAVAGAVSLSEVLVKVEFTADLDLTHGGNLNPVNYSIAGLSVLGVDSADGPAVLLHTTPQGDESYLVAVNATAGRIRTIGADYLDPTRSEATFEGHPAKATFTATAQSGRKVLVRFSEAVASSDFSEARNFHLTQVDGLTVPIEAVEPVGIDGTRLQLLLARSLTPMAYHSLRLGSALKSAAGKVFLPDRARFQWKMTANAVRVDFERFSGEVSGGLLGNPAGQVFLSPAFGTSAANSVLEVESVTACTRSFDVYRIPKTAAVPGPTFLGPGSEGPLVLWGAPYTFGRASTHLHDRQSEALSGAMDGPAVGSMSEPIDISRAAFSNDDRWRTFPAVGASLGVFRTADNATPIGAGPDTGPFALG